MSVFDNPIVHSTQYTLSLINSSKNTTNGDPENKDASFDDENAPPRPGPDHKKSFSYEERDGEYKPQEEFEKKKNDDSATPHTLMQHVETSLAVKLAELR